jgi:hypothetical protein
MPPKISGFVVNIRRFLVLAIPSEADAGIFDAEPQMLELLFRVRSPAATEMTGGTESRSRSVRGSCRRDKQPE